MHFWTWRKQQQKLQANAKKMAKMEDMQPDDSPPPSAVISPPTSSANSNSNLAPKRPHSGGIGTFKDILGREKLMEVGGRVEKMLQDPDTPNETKLKGFAQVLLDEWSKGIIIKTKHYF